MNVEKKIAKNLLDIKAVSLRPNEPFTWAVVEGFVELIKKEYPEAEILMGTATAGISWAALVADKMELPMGYVRSSNKDHGKGNKIEGNLPKGAKVVIVEDLISTGGSVKGVVEALREAGAEVLGVVAIFTYLLPASTQLFTSINCDFKTLSNYDVLVEVAKEMDYIQESDMEKLLAWKQDPNDESWMNK